MKNWPKLSDEQKIDETMMPSKGSKWIIFISDTEPPHSIFETFHDLNFPYSRENLDTVLDELERVDPSEHFDSLSRQKLDAMITDGTAQSYNDYSSYRSHQSPK